MNWTLNKSRAEDNICPKNFHFADSPSFFARSLEPPGLLEERKRILCSFQNEWKRGKIWVLLWRNAYFCSRPKKFLLLRKKKKCELSGARGDWLLKVLHAGCPRVDIRSQFLGNGRDSRRSAFRLLDCCFFFPFSTLMLRDVEYFTRSFWDKLVLLFQSLFFGKLYWACK